MLKELIEKISDHGDILLSKGIHHFGVWVGIVGGASVNAAGKIVTDQSPVVGFVLEWGGLISMVAAGTLILKNLVDMSLGVLKARWDRQEQIKRMNDDNP